VKAEPLTQAAPGRAQCGRSEELFATPDELGALLVDTARRQAAYLSAVEHRKVSVSPADAEALEELGGPLPETSRTAREVIEELDRVGAPATMASAGPRYFGFVIGGALPVTVAAASLAAAWDQNAGFHTTSPVAAVLEDITRRWMLDLLDLPREAAVGFVTGATMASFTALAAARDELLARDGWDVRTRGLSGAPPLRVVAGDEAHVAVLKALSLLGIGLDQVERAPVDDQGRIRPERLPDLDGRTIVCLQAGNVNSGAFDPAEPVCSAAKAAGAWVHVDGAFGLWARAAPARRSLAMAYDQADSWAIDAHKWLNTPHDCGMAVVRRSEALRSTMTAWAPYLVETEHRQPCHYTPELSRRARGVEVWAALRALGRSGVAQLIEASCRRATQMAGLLRAAGFEILNEVALNQVLVSFGGPEETRRVIAAVQEDGTCWCGGTQWQGRTAMRISVSSWRTTEADVARSAEAIINAAHQVRADSF
jgi:glutamate/tyrosine decarboxylase-like PLP-dependent enzyme